MKNILFILAALLLGACAGTSHETDPQLLELIDRLDAEIDVADRYAAAKEARIASLRAALAVAHGRCAVSLTDSLIDEFEAYNADSALRYVGANLHRPEVVASPRERTRLSIKRADILAHAGLFSDALATLATVDRAALDSALLLDYYYAYCSTYQYLSEYTDEHETSIEPERLRALYTDSLRLIATPRSFTYLVYVVPEMARHGQSEQAIDILTRRLDDYRPGTRQYSIVTSILSYLHRRDGHSDQATRYMVLTAISDLRGAVKENVSFRGMANDMLERGDVERAHNYLKKSIDDANFYSALIRNVQSGKMLPVIDEAYASMQHRLTSRLRTMAWLSALLSLVLIVTVVFILMQMRRLHSVNDRLNSANDRLSSLSDSLSDANAHLETINGQLRDFNRVKEQYAGLFMQSCSAAISALQQYQQSLRVLAAQNGNRAALIKKIESTEATDRMLRDFYASFDEAVLHIYPDFVQKFNDLLLPDRRIVLRPAELLNTELRLYALIRIGIDDSAKIAGFLRCSLSTVYTYRSKLRRRAIDPDNFETAVRSIS